MIQISVACVTRALTAPHQVTKSRALSNISTSGQRQAYDIYRTLNPYCLCLTVRIGKNNILIYSTHDVNVLREGSTAASFP